MITHVRDDSGALDALLLLLNKAGESTHVNEVTELLAHASVKDGNLSRARDLYQMLATTEPQNQLHMQNYQQVVGRMEEASPSVGITAEEGSVIVEELEATAPVIDQFYPDNVAIAVRAAVTDADLFLSYNLPDKAVVPLDGFGGAARPQVVIAAVKSDDGLPGGLVEAEGGSPKRGLTMGHGVPSCPLTR